MSEPTLVEKLLTLVVKVKSPLDDELIGLATKLEEAVARNAQPDRSEATMKSMLGAWARARRRYCELTGEPLL